MKKRWILLGMTSVLAFACAFCMQSGAVETGSSTIRVIPSERLNEISPLLFGAAIEWADNGNGLYDAKSAGLRQDILDDLEAVAIVGASFSGRHSFRLLSLARWSGTSLRPSLPSSSYGEVRPEEQFWNG